MENLKLYKCDICNNIIMLLEGNNDNIICCNSKMKKLEANTFEASKEKHIPSYEINNDEIIVTVGEIEHPMEEDHYIMWIILKTDNELIKVNLKPGYSPTCKFKYVPNSTIYAYCNKHGL